MKVFFYIIIGISSLLRLGGLVTAFQTKFSKAEVTLIVEYSPESLWESLIASKFNLKLWK